MMMEFETLSFASMAADRGGRDGTPPPVGREELTASPPAKRTVTFAPTRTTIYFQRALDGSKIPSDAIAPLGLGNAVTEECEPLDEAMHRRSADNWIMPIPPNQRVEMLKGACTHEAMAAAVQQNVMFLRELNDSRMRLVLSGKRGRPDESDSEEEEEEEETPPPVKRAKTGLSSSSSSSGWGSGRTIPGGKCHGCRRVNCLCVQL